MLLKEIEDEVVQLRRPLPCGGFLESLIFWHGKRVGFAGEKAMGNGQWAIGYSLSAIGERVFEMTSPWEVIKTRAVSEAEGMNS